MISPELLRRYPFFAGLEDGQLKAIAMIAEEITCPAGTIIFEEGQTAEAFYLLIDGNVVLSFNAPAANGGQIEIGEVNPGEPFAISALIPPHVLTHTARAGSVLRAIKIAAAPLRSICDQDPRLGYILMRSVAEAAMERLHFTRVQLAAART